MRTRDCGMVVIVVVVVVVGCLGFEAVELALCLLSVW